MLIKKCVKDCQYGKRYKEKKETPPSDTCIKRIQLQDTRKSDCHAHVEVKYYIVFPEYKVDDAEMT